MLKNNSYLQSVRLPHPHIRRPPLTIHPFSILNSPFSFLHSPFSILNSPFSIPHSSFKKSPACLATNGTLKVSY